MHEAVHIDLLVQEADVGRSAKFANFFAAFGFRPSETKKAGAKSHRPSSHRISNQCQYIRGQKQKAIAAIASFREFGWDAQPAMPMAGI
jgi:hypothetical protein